MSEPLILANRLAPGDHVVMTAAVRDLALKHPGRYSVIAKTTSPDVWLNNPHVHKTLPISPKPRFIEMHYPLFQKQDPPQDGAHFLWGFIEYLNDKLGLKGDERVALTQFRPALYLSHDEAMIVPFSHPYWVVVSGGKWDFTCKWWSAPRMQNVVDSMPDVRFVQVGAAGHHHPRLNNVIDLVGKTTLRDLICLIYHSQGVICPVTCVMHIAAAFNKPCVVLAGGREGWWWEAYTSENRQTQMTRGIPWWIPAETDAFVPHKYLHTIGELDCCAKGGCKRTKIKSVNPHAKACFRPVKDINDAWIPACMDSITAHDVVSAVREYINAPLLVTRY